MSTTTLSRGAMALLGVAALCAVGSLLALLHQPSAVGPLLLIALVAVLAAAALALAEGHLLLRAARRDSVEQALQWSGLTLGRGHPLVAEGDGLRLRVDFGASRGMRCAITSTAGGRFSTGDRAHVDDDAVQVRADRVTLDLHGACDHRTILEAVIRTLRVASARRIDDQSSFEHVEQLASAGDPRALEALAARWPDDARLQGVYHGALGHEVVAVHRLAQRGLSTQALIAIADDADLPDDRRSAALDALAERTLPALGEHLDRWLDDPSLRSPALRLMASSGADLPGGAARIRALLPGREGHAADAELAEAVAGALGNWPDPESTPILLALNDHRAPDVRRAALRALATVGTAAALPRLLRLAQTDDSPEMKAAVSGIRARATQDAGGLSVASDPSPGRLSPVADDPDGG